MARQLAKPCRFLMVRRLLNQALPALLVVLPAQAAQAQGLAGMAGASATQGTLQGASMPTYSGALNRARNTMAGANTGSAPNPEAGQANGAAAPTGGNPAASPGPSGSTPSGASVNGKPIPLCSHGGLCQGALMRAMGRP